MWFRKRIAKNLEKIAHLKEIAVVDKKKNGKNNNDDEEDSRISKWKDFGFVLKTTETLKKIVTTTYGFKLACVLAWNKAFDTSVSDKETVWEYVLSHTDIRTKNACAVGATEVEGRRYGDSREYESAGMIMYGTQPPYTDSSVAERIRSKGTPGVPRAAIGLGLTQLPRI
jgi:hypothetical protein